MIAFTSYRQKIMSKALQTLKGPEYCDLLISTHLNNATILDNKGQLLPGHRIGIAWFPFFCRKYLTCHLSYIADLH